MGPCRAQQLAFGVPELDGVSRGGGENGAAAVGGKGRHLASHTVVSLEILHLPFFASAVLDLIA